jgi:hypothetical protein
MSVDFAQNKGGYEFSVDFIENTADIGLPKGFCRCYRKQMQLSK